MSGRVLAALVVLFALLAREVPLSFRSSELAGGAVTASETAWRLHRVSLAIASPRLAQVDRAISFPGAEAVTQLPVYDELCALGARLALRLSRGDVGELPDPVRLERFLRGLGPLLMCATLLLLYRWLKKRPGAENGAPLSGLVLVACLPGFFEVGVPGQLSIEALAAPGLVLTLAWLEGTWTARDPLDRMTQAMLAGAALGLGLATSPLFVVVLLACYVAFAFDLSRVHGVERQDQARTALLFWISSALVAQLPTLGGPWVPALEGPVAAWTGWLRQLMLLGVLPLVVALAQPQRELSTRALHGLVLAASLLALALLFDSEARSLFAPLRSARLVSSGVLVALLGLPLLLAWRRGRPLEGHARVLFLTGAGGLLLAPLAPVAGVLALVPLAAWGSDLARERRARQLVWCAGGLFVLASVARPVHTSEEEELRRDLVVACTWLEEHTPPSGPLGAATAVHDWGVGVEPELAPLVAWHARRAASGLGSPWTAADQSGARTRALREARTWEEFVAASRAAGLRYWLLSPRTASALGLSAELSRALELQRTAGEGVLLREGAVSLLALGPG